MLILFEIIWRMVMLEISRLHLCVMIVYLCRPKATFVCTNCN